MALCPMEQEEQPQPFHNALQEAFFWKQLADALLEQMNVNKEIFYKDIEPMRELWNKDELPFMLEDCKKTYESKALHIKKGFKHAIIGTQESLIAEKEANAS